MPDVRSGGVFPLQPSTVGQLSVVSADHKAGVQFLDSPGRGEAAGLGQHTFYSGRLEWCSAIHMTDLQVSHFYARNVSDGDA